MRFSAATTAVVAVALVVVLGGTVERVRAGYWIPVRFVLFVAPWHKF